MTNIPKLCRHKSSNQSFVTYAGKQYYLGPWRSKDAQRAYARFVAELSAGQVPTLAAVRDLTVSELCLSFLEARKADLTKGNISPKQFDACKRAVALMDELYGTTLAADFGPKALKACMHHKAKYRSAQTANNFGQLIRAVIKWGVHQELIPADSLVRIQGVPGVKPEEAGVPPKLVLPVPMSDFEKTLPELPPMLRDLMQLAKITGARIGELLIMRPCDLEPYSDQRGKLWLFSPMRHKTARHGHERIIVLGDDDRIRYLARWLENVKPDAFVFTPARSEQVRLAELHLQRVTPMNQGNRPGYGPRDRHTITTELAELPQKRRIDADKPYDSTEIGKAVKRACDRAKVPHWGAHQLRHAKASDVTAILSSDAAQAVLGHARRTTTERYAKVNTRRAVEAHRQIDEVRRQSG